MHNRTVPLRVKNRRLFILLIAALLLGIAVMLYLHYHSEYPVNFSNYDVTNTPVMYVLSHDGVTYSTPADPRPDLETAQSLNAVLRSISNLHRIPQPDIINTNSPYIQLWKWPRFFPDYMLYEGKYYTFDNHGEIFTKLSEILIEDRRTELLS